MNFGLSPNDYRFIKSELQNLEEKGAKIYCFGSRARGDYSKFSDLDLMVESEADLSLELSNAKEAFEESMLPIKVDIVELKNFAKEYLDGYSKDRVEF